MRSPMCLTLLAVLLGAAVGAADAYPRPARVSSRPEAAFRPGALRMYQSPAGEYWYLLYDVVNTTGQDLTWAPSMVLYTDRGDVLADGQGVPRRIAQAVMDHVGDPLLEPKAAVIGKLRQGLGHARRGIAIWPAPHTDINEIRIFVEGISPESTVVDHPITGEPVTLRKNLALHYLVPGNPTALRDEPISLHPDYAAEEHWIYR